MIGLPNCACASLRKSANSSLVNLSYRLKKLRPSSVISPEDDRFGVGSRVGVDGALSLGGVDAPAGPGVGYHDGLVLDAPDAAVPSPSRG